QHRSLPAAAQYRHRKRESATMVLQSGYAAVPDRRLQGPTGQREQLPEPLGLRNVVPAQPLRSRHSLPQRRSNRLLLSEQSSGMSTWLLLSHRCRRVHKRLLSGA
ncbi:hypothetical protein AAVH_35217, partial [Aphelenchoides avenae]